MIIREKKKEGGPPALRVMAPDTNTWVREKGPPREEGIVYSDYMGSGLGNKPSHGGNGYKIGSMVATVLSRLGLEARDRESRAYARAEQEQSDFEKVKDRSARGDRYTRAKSAWLCGHTMARGRARWKAQEGGQSRDGKKRNERKKEIWREGGKGEEKGAATPGAILLEFK